MAEYVVIADLGREAISLEAESEGEAIQKAREIIADTYNSGTLADSTTFEIEGAN